MNSATPENLIAGAKIKDEKAKVEVSERKLNEAFKRKLDRNINKTEGLKKAKFNVEAKKTQKPVKTMKQPFQTTSANKTYVAQKQQVTVLKIL